MVKREGICTGVFFAPIPVQFELLSAGTSGSSRSFKTESSGKEAEPAEGEGSEAHAARVFP